MTRDEFSAYIASVTDPVKAPEALASIRDGVEELFATNEAAQAQATKDKATIAELQGVNMRLFLRGGNGGRPETQQDEETLEDYNARIGKMIRGEKE